MQEINDKFHSWPDPKKLNEIREKLKYIFQNRGCWNLNDIEDNVSETMFRFYSKSILGDLKINSEEQMMKYLHGIAKHVLHEYWRRRKQNEREKPTDFQESEPYSIDSEKIEDERLECLNKCMQRLDPDERELIKQYSEADNHYTEELVKNVEELNPNAIRVRIHRIIRKKLRPCIEKCLK